MKLRVERLHGGATDALLVQARALAPLIDSRFTRVLFDLELAKLLPPAAAAAEYLRLYSDPAAGQRPGLLLHAAACAAAALRAAGRAREAAAWAAKAKHLRGSCHPYDLTNSELQACLGR